jgi:predicted transcriptional regulator
MNDFPSRPRLDRDAKSCADLVQCLYNLAELDMEILRRLMTQGPARAEDLADELGRDRSTVYRSLQKLVTCQSVAKETRSLERGGHFHLYTAVPKDVLRMRLEDCIEEWHGRLLEMLGRFDEDMDVP